MVEKEEKKGLVRPSHNVVNEIIKKIQVPPGERRFILETLIEDEEERKELVRDLKEKGLTPMSTNPWEGYFALGDLTSELKNKGYDPIGVEVFLDETAAPFAGGNYRDGYPFKSGTYKIETLPEEKEVSGEELSLIMVACQSVQGKIQQVRADFHIFKSSY